MVFRIRLALDVQKATKEPYPTLNPAKKHQKSEPHIYSKQNPSCANSVRQEKCKVHWKITSINHYSHLLAMYHLINNKANENKENEIHASMKTPITRSNRIKHLR